MSFWTAVSALAGVARLGDLQASHMHQKPLIHEMLEIEWNVRKILPPDIVRERYWHEPQEAGERV